MLDKDFPCKTCGHKAERHFLSICGSAGICLQCATSKLSITPDEHWHDFEGDNLKFVELQQKREALRNE
ncbi:MAG: hypothetical protein ACREBR_04720 [bacterium]